MCKSVTGLQGIDRGEGYESRGNHEQRGPAREETEAAKGEGWKKTLEGRFKCWIETFEKQEDIPTASEEEIDLYSFYEQLCVLRSEFRKNARRSHDTFSRFGETLAQFETMIKALASDIAEKQRCDEEADVLSKKRTYLPLVEMFERFKRIDERLARPPKAGLFSGRRAWEEAWSNLREAFGILRAHFEGLLEKAGVEAIDAAGKPFDPSLMMAVEVQETSALEPNTVVEETSSGYLYRGHILKLAEVKVARRKGPEE